MCFCNPNIRTMYCNSHECEREKERLHALVKSKMDDFKCGDHVLVQDQGSSWTRRVFIAETSEDRFLCMTHEEYQSLDLGSPRGCDLWCRIKIDNERILKLDNKTYKVTKEVHDQIMDLIK